MSKANKEHYSKEHYSKERLAKRFTAHFGHDPTVVTPTFVQGRSPDAPIEGTGTERATMVNTANLHPDTNEVWFSTKLSKLKWCCSCKQELLSAQFGQCKSYADGKNPRCRDCVSIHQRNWYLRKKALLTCEETANG